MKKYILLLSCITVLCFAIFAQDKKSNQIPSSDRPITEEDLETKRLQTEVIIPEKQHCTDDTASVKIEYMPMYDEVRIYYECMYVTYDRGEAMNTVILCLDDFQKEHKYFSYKYLKDDKERFFKDDKGRRKAQYMSYVKFNR